MSCARPRPRMRLPAGFGGLRADLGEIIRSYRQGEAGMGEPIAPKVFAARVGIGRVALSRIENGKAWPRSETLKRMMAIFELDWAQVAEVGSNTGSHPRMPDTPPGWSASLSFRISAMGTPTAWLDARRACPP